MVHGSLGIGKCKQSYEESVGKGLEDIQRSAKVLARGLVKFVPALAKLAGANFTKKPHTNTFADLCT